MWFESLMDDFKHGLVISNKHKDIFVPVFLKLAMFLILGIIGFIGIVTTMASGIFSGVNELQGTDLFFSIISPMIFTILVGYITYLILWAFIEIGTLGLIKAAINDEELGKKHFFDSIKAYIIKATSGKFLIHFVGLCLSPLILVFYVLFTILIGIPTAGWGLIFLQVAIGVYFSMWTIGIVSSSYSVFEAIKMSFRLSRLNFKPMFLLILTATMVTKYVVTLLGPVGVLLAGWFVGGVLATYFKVIIYLKYLEYSKVYIE